MFKEVDSYKIPTWILKVDTHQNGVAFCEEEVIVHILSLSVSLSFFYQIFSHNSSLHQQAKYAKCGSPAPTTQNSIYWCALFISINTKSQSRVYEEIFYTFCETGWCLRILPPLLRSKKSYDSINFFLVLGLTVWNKASPTRGHGHSMSINQSVSLPSLLSLPLTHTHSHQEYCLCELKMWPLSFFNFLPVYLVCQQFAILFEVTTLFILFAAVLEEGWVWESTNG